jgi:hypothetical protein
MVISPRFGGPLFFAQGETVAPRTNDDARMTMRHTPRRRSCVLLAVVRAGVLPEPRVFLSRPLAQRQCSQQPSEPVPLLRMARAVLMGLEAPMAHRHTSRPSWVAAYMLCRQSGILDDCWLHQLIETRGETEGNARVRSKINYERCR